MKNNTALIVVGVVLLLAIPVTVLALRKRDKDDKKNKDKKKSSVVAGSPEVQTQQQFEKDRQAATTLPGPISGLTQYIASLPTYVVTGEGVNIRQEPNTSSKILGKLKKGEKVKGNAPKDGWVMLARADRAFVSANYLRKVAEGASAVK